MSDAQIRETLKQAEADPDGIVMCKGAYLATLCRAALALDAKQEPRTEPAGAGAAREDDKNAAAQTPESASLGEVDLPIRPSDAVAPVRPLDMALSAEHDIAALSFCVADDIKSMEGWHQHEDWLVAHEEDEDSSECIHLDTVTAIVKRVLAWRPSPLDMALPSAGLTGWKLVPIEPTVEMDKAAYRSLPSRQRHLGYDIFRNAYRAMLAASPQVSEPAEGTEGRDGEGSAP